MAIPLLVALTPIYGNCKALEDIEVVTSLPKEGLHEIKIKEETTLSKILEKGNVLSMNYWDLSVDNNEETCLCVITEHTLRMGEDVLPYRILSFYKKNDDKFAKIYKFISGDSFLGMYPMGEVNRNLFTLWVAGSAYHFEVFSLIDNKIKLVLDSGSKEMPEIADIDNDEEPEILLSEGHFKAAGKNDTVFIWETTGIYKWNGKSYKLVKTVPWKNRFNALKPRNSKVGKH